MSSSTLVSNPSLPRRSMGSGLITRISGLLMNEQERWILWLPVGIGVGIAIYFALDKEPPAWVGPASALVVGISSLGLLLAVGDGVLFVRAVIAAAMASTIGFAAAQIKTTMIEPRMLTKRVGPALVTGVVADVEAFPEGQRVTLVQPSITRLQEQAAPARVRIRLRGNQPTVRPGDRVRLPAILNPPPPPALPGGYDFQRQAFFDGIDAVGFSVGTATTLPPAGGSNGGIGLWFANLRFTVGERVRAHVQGAAAAVSIALLTGEQRAIPETVMASIRDSGLAHLLSISGLHIGLVAGIVLVTVRSILALIPKIALRYPIKKWAAVASVAAAGAYTLLAAAPVPSQRSFLMISIVLLAVLVDRQGLSMRLIAFAALVILLSQPDSMLGPSFQMSFAAVVALIAAYEALRDRRRVPLEQPSSGTRALLYLGGIILSTIIAGTATAPFAAYHFNRFQVFGVVANMVAIPTTSFWVMPWAIVAAILMPLHLEGLALVPMAWGVEVVLWIARVVAAWPGAVVLLPPMPVWGLGVITIGGIWLCLWRGLWRWFGLAGIAAGGLALLTVDVPDLMIDGSGRLTAARTENDGLILSSRTLGRSTRQAWLQRAGQVDVEGSWPGQSASTDGRLRCDTLGCVLRAGGHVVALVHNGEALPDDCRLADVIVSIVPVRGDCRSATTVIDRFDLWRNGAHALWLDDGRVRIESVDGIRGQRPWVLRHWESAASADNDDESSALDDATPSMPGAKSSTAISSGGGGRSTGLVP